MSKHRKKRSFLKKSGLLRGIDGESPNKRTQNRRRIRFEVLEERRVLNGDSTLSNLFNQPMPFSFPDIAEGESSIASLNIGSPAGIFAPRIPLTGTNPWRNPSIRLDVNADGTITPQDVLVQFNWLNAEEPNYLGEIVPPPGLPGHYLDTNGDDWIAPIDALNVINWLNHKVPLAGNDGFLVIKNSSDMSLDVLENDILLLESGGTVVVSSVIVSNGESVISILDGQHLRYSPPPDFMGVDTFQYEAIVNGERTVVGTVAVTVSATNHSPSVLNPLTEISVDEDAAPQSVELAQVFSDADFPLGDRLQLSLENNDESLVTASLEGTQLVLTFHRHANGQADIVVIATDLAGEQTASSLRVNVIDVNDSPTGANNAITTSEDIPYTFDLSDFRFSDPHDVPPHNLLSIRITALPTLGLLTLNNTPVEIDENISAADIAAGRLSFAPPEDAHGIPYTSLQFQVQDDGGAAGGGNDLDSTPRILTINLSPVNDPPADIVLSNSVLSEQMPVASTVGQLTPIDPDNELATVLLVAGIGNDDNDAFIIDGQELKTAVSLDFETQSIYRIRVRATDDGGLSVERTFEIQVTNENESPTDITLSSSSIAENSPIGSIVGQLSAADPDATDAATFTLVSGEGDDDNAAFVIDGLDLKTTASLDFETQSTYHIRVRAVDAEGLAIEQPFIIYVTNVNEAPVNQVPASQQTQPNQPLIFSSANGNAIRITDVDAGAESIHVRLIPQHGTIEVDEFFGSLDEVNELLDGLIFNPDLDYQGEASLEVIANDLGNTGLGGALSDVDEITIFVQ